MKLVVVNDMHPIQAPGAASIAYSLARSARDTWNVEFWCGWGSASSRVSDSDLHVKSFLVDIDLERRRLENLARKLWAEFFPGKIFWWFFLQIIRSRPDVIWVHQIGVRFPRSILLITKLLRIRTVWTIHDFGLILPRKLYPRDLGIDDSEVDNFVLQLPHLITNKSKFNLEKIEYSNVLKLRLKLLLGLASFANQIIFISPLQQQIYSVFGFQSKVVIPNGVELCSCKINAEDKDSKSILFAGRSTGKGFQFLLSAMLSNPEFHLHLAGGEELRDYASRRLEDSRFTYHGHMNSSEIYKLIHSVTLVSVASECFDVFPTITLEALRHGACA